MKCEKCNINPTTVHVQQIINGEKTDKYFCQSCAGEAADSGISFGNLLQGIMDAVIKSAISGAGNIAAQDTPVKCPSCGFTGNDFKKTGKLGCGYCYSAFKNELGHVLKSIHGNNVHEGKFPHKSGIEMMQKKTLENLRLSLSKAIQDEEFEKAASLRDKIKEMEAADGKVV